MHGRRVNEEKLEREGSGYVGRRGTDLLFAQDKWFRGMELSTGPDGGVFALDWSDTGECHDSTGVHRTSSRIFKITHGDPSPNSLTDLTKLSIPELVKLHTHQNDWWARQARLALAARAADGGGVAEAADSLWELVKDHTDPVHQLRAPLDALWHRSGRRNISNATTPSRE